LLFDINALRSMMHELCAPPEVFSQENGNCLHIVPRALAEEYGLDRLLIEIFSCEDEDRYKRLFILSKLLSFMIQTDKMFSAHKERFAAPAAKDGLVSAAITYINEHIGDPIRLEEMAKNLFVSKSTLCHRFAKTVHMTTMHYILTNKMHRAAELLRKGYAATQVASMVGYENYTSFF
jgi:AraC-like DNA-binding protein